MKTQNQIIENLEKTIKTLNKELIEKNEMIKETKISRETKKPSKSYTLKSFTENIQKIRKFGWITEDENNQLQSTLKNCIQKYTQEEYGNY